MRWGWHKLTLLSQKWRCRWNISSPKGILDIRHLDNLFLTEGPQPYSGPKCTRSSQSGSHSFSCHLCRNPLSPRGGREVWDSNQNYQLPPTPSRAQTLSGREVASLETYVLIKLWDFLSTQMLSAPAGVLYVPEQKKPTYLRPTWLHG